MKIISWNTLFNNKKKGDGLKYILSLDPDVICLQEFKGTDLDLINNSDYHVTVNLTAKGKNHKNDNYKVIMIKKNHRIESHEEFITYDKKIRSSLKFLSKIIFNRKRDYHQGQYVDTNDYRIINLHLDAFAGPFARTKQLREALKNLSYEKKNIICGDFNTYGNLISNLVLYPLIQFDIRKIFFHERKNVNDIIVKNNLQNPFFRKPTSVPAFLQLDYILLDKDSDIKNKKVIKKRFGSDHKILFLEE